ESSSRPLFFFPLPSVLIHFTSPSSPPSLPKSRRRRPIRFNQHLRSIGKKHIPFSSEAAAILAPAVAVVARGSSTVTYASAS
ncbi:unnamed protein product, partial [Urochloa humidicola]